MGEFVRVRARMARRRAFDDAISGMVEALECHHVTGEDCYVVKVATRSMSHLEEVVAELGRYGETTTSLVFSSPVANRVLARDRSTRKPPLPGPPPELRLRGEGVAAFRSAAFPE